MKIALVYDRINKIGGAERILSALLDVYPQAPLYTLVHNFEKAPWAKKITIKKSFMQKLPFAKTYHEFYPVLPVFAFENFDFSKYDIVISLTSTEAKGIITSPNTLHICYLLTPIRYLWSHYYDYFDSNLLKYLSLPIISLIRLWDFFSARRPDKYVTISQTVQKRIRKYYRLESNVIYPPVKLVDRMEKRILQKKRDTHYFLVVSRLVKYKHIEIVIQACNVLGLSLKIIGSGFEKNRLKSIAHKKVEFLENLTDQSLSQYYQNCRALICPQEEDFGITAVEALAHGSPVIAFKSGGISEIVEPGVTGEFFYPQKKEALVETLVLFMQKTYSEVLCRKSAERFSEINFKILFSKFISDAWLEHQNNNKIN